MYNQVLWTLDNETDDTVFERLCTDLLGREGYSDIVPIGGGHDRGRDAEIRHWKGIKQTGGITFFQYSLEDAWESKLKRELAKVKNNQHKIDYYVFVTSQKVTGEKRDKLAAAVLKDYGWELIIYDREWLRHRLEEKHQDLADKYLHIEISQTTLSKQSGTLIKIGFDENILPLYERGEYDLAVVEIKRLIKNDNNNFRFWQMLAWCQYCLFHYNDALISINQAILLNDKDDLGWSIKASILTEDGIQKGVKANLLLARDIFKKTAQSSGKWDDHYNYGNVLHALGSYKEARDEFLKAINIDGNQSMVWKNLGTVYYHLKNHKEEIKCYDKALAINNKNAEAWASKGITVLAVYNEAKKASGLIEKAIEVNPSLANRWPHIWYWLGEAYKRTSNFQKVLENSRKGLSITPSHLGLLNLKSIALSHLWQQDKQFVQEAIEFFDFRLELSSEDYDSFAELVKIHLANENKEEALRLIDKYADIKTINLLDILDQLGIEIKDLLISLRYSSSYKKFRAVSTMSRYKALFEEQGIILSKDFEDTLFAVCIIPFGLSCDLLAHSRKTASRKVIAKLYSLAQNSIKTIFPKLGRLLAGSINKDSMDKTIDDISKTILTWPLIALIELSGLTGFVGGTFGLSIDEISGALDSQEKKLSQWQAQIAGDTFIEINKEIKLVKETK